MRKLDGCGVSYRGSLAVRAALVMILSAGSAQAGAGSADGLLAIDQHRSSVIERIVATWGVPLAQSSANVSIDELRVHLQALRADELLAASLAGTPDGLRDVLAQAAATSAAVKASAVALKSLGDKAIDDVYTPVTPCRLVETRGTFAAVYQGNGTAAHTPVPFAPNEIRSYTLQGANGVCLAQLPAGLAPSAVQLQVFGMPTTSASGDIEVLPQGSAFGSTATMVYIASIAFNTVSTATRVNLANNQISVQVRGGGAHLALDVVGYFKSASDATGMNVVANGERVMRFDYNATSPNVIGGNAANTVSAGVRGGAIGGGGSATGADNGLFPNSGPNQVTDHYGIVAGGLANVAGSTGADPTDAPYATVAGGKFNRARAKGSMIGGGDSNTASGPFSFVGGGAVNIAQGQFSVVAGGGGFGNSFVIPPSTIAKSCDPGDGRSCANIASNSYGAVGGGAGNRAGGDPQVDPDHPGAVVGGGVANTASGTESVVAGGFYNVASATTATVGGGASNLASGQSSVVAGGTVNRASGQYSSVPGGLSNEARGDLSVAAGFNAIVNGRNSFLFASGPSDGTVAATITSSPYEFAVAATGGIAMGTAVDFSNVCRLAPGGGSWSCTSDRNAKKDFAPVDTEDVLAKVAALPITTWRFKTESDAITHMGPMAQDFRAAFGLGIDDKTITQVDVNGVALAAIQGLHRELEHQARLIAMKDAEIDRLQTQVRRIIQALAASGAAPPFSDDD